MHLTLVSIGFSTSDMLPEHTTEIALDPGSDALPVIVIGAGPVGVRVVLEICRQLPDYPIRLFSDEPWTPNKRIKRNPFITAEIDHAELNQTIGLTEKNHVITHFNESVVSIDRENRSITTRYGNCYVYRHVILATGSQPNVPRIPGIGLAGVHTFRDMTDTQQLYASITRSRHTVVIGGGVLGLEAAKAMRRFNTRVTVIEHSDHLLFQQLDVQGAEFLRMHMELRGIRIRTNESVRQILGSLTVQGVELRSGETFKCDTIILAVGIQPNIELARDAGLVSRRGIMVNDRLQTSDPLIYAVGECVEHRGVISGLIAPGYEQAYVVARALADRPAMYTGSISVTNLQVAGYPVFSMGDVQESQWEADAPIFVDQTRGIYRKLTIERDRLVGVIALGDWSDIPRLREMVYNKRRLMPWHLWRFRKTGRLWHNEGVVDLLSWPSSATLCNCTGISLARLYRELDNGASSVEDLTAATGAGTVCGTCKPLLVNLIHCSGVDTDGNRHLFAGASMIVALLTLLFLIPFGLPINQSTQNPLPWNDAFYQLSGYVLFVFGVILGLLSLRKRIIGFTWGSIKEWRLFHIIFGVMTTALLLFHTGLRLGHELNFLLMISFIGLLLSGSMLGGLYGFERRMPAGWIRRTRRLSQWAHLLLFWPFPLLLGIHIAKTYGF